MGTASEAGTPGEHLSGPPLNPAEDEVLERLRADADGDPLKAAEDTAAMTAAAADDSTLPVVSGEKPGTAADSAEFIEPAGP